MHQEVVLFGCGQTYPEYLANRKQKDDVDTRNYRTMRECCFKPPDHHHKSSHLRMTREIDVPNIQIKKKALT